MLLLQHLQCGQAAAEAVDPRIAASPSERTSCDRLGCGGSSSRRRGRRSPTVPHRITKSTPPHTTTTAQDSTNSPPLHHHHHSISITKTKKSSQSPQGCCNDINTLCVCVRVETVAANCKRRPPLKVCDMQNPNLQSM